MKVNRLQGEQIYRRSIKQGVERQFWEGRIVKTKRFILSPHLCKNSRCKGPELLVKVSLGGVINRKCLKCGRMSTVNLADLPALECENDGTSLRAETQQRLYGNYEYKCEKCGKTWEVHKFLPLAEELD